MKKISLMLAVGLAASLLMLSATEFEGFYFWKNGAYTRFDALSIFFGNDSITIGDATFDVSEVDSITFAKPAETGETVTDTVFIAFDGTAATVTPASVAGITTEVDGANVNLTNANEDREMTFVLSGESQEGSFTYNGTYKACIRLAGLSLT